MSRDIEPDDPQVAQLAPGLLLHAAADVRGCDCGERFVSPAYLEAHRKRDHSGAEPVTEP